LAARKTTRATRVPGGEYGTLDLLGQRRTIAREKARVDSLERSIAQLQLERKAIEGDAATQERIAREEFGMVKGDRELLYRFVDSTR
jgi:cell division protein FtsB